MTFFDCNCSYGCSARPALRYAATPDELLAEMDFCGIDGALVYHANLRSASPVNWNDVLATEIHGRERLAPAWAILPPATGELPPPEVFLSRMRAANVRALWAFPHEHRYRLDGTTFGELFRALARQRVPLFARQNLSLLKELLVDCPDLIVVAADQGPHSAERYLRPLLDAFPNLHLETSGLLVEGLIEEFCERYGPHRLLFGTGFPDNSAGGALLRLAHADIGAEARTAIAGGNLERLLGEVDLSAVRGAPDPALCRTSVVRGSPDPALRPTAGLPLSLRETFGPRTRRGRETGAEQGETGAEQGMGVMPPPGNPSPIAREFLERGRSESCPIIDLHGHWGPFGGSYLPAANPPTMIHALERAGVQFIVCSAHDALFADPVRGNATMQAAIDEYPDRLRGYWAVNPNYPELAARAPDDLEQARGFVGFKFLPDYHTYAVTGDCYRAALEYADAHALPVLIHTWGGSAYNSPPHIAQLAERYPRAQILMGHSGYGAWEASATLARQAPHVYLELTACYAAHDFALLPGGSGTPVGLASCLHVNGVIEYLVARAGSEKVVFGTDLPWYSPHFAAGAVLFARITDEDRHNILHRNAERILRPAKHSIS